MKDPLRCDEGTRYLTDAAAIYVAINNRLGGTGADRCVECICGEINKILRKL